MSELTPATVDAINTRFPDNEAHGQLALMYAQVYAEDPAAFWGMIAAGQHVMHSELRDIYSFLTPLRELVMQYKDDPEGVQLTLKEAIGAYVPTLMAKMLASMNNG